MLSAAGRDARIGSELDCPLCDRAELPPGLTVARSAGPFNAATLPAALQRAHKVADHTWGCIRVLDGSIRFTMDTAPPVDRQLDAGDDQPIPPGVPHAVHLQGTALVVVDFLVPTPATSS